MTFRLPIVVLFASFAAAACSGGSPTAPTSGGGSNASTTSHNAGRDCISCHSFTVAGTVYKADGAVYPRAVVRLTTADGGTGTVVTTITADASGNFYTSAAVSFGAGLYTTVTGTSGSVRSMSASITSGACNRCHGAGGRIVVD